MFRCVIFNSDKIAKSVETPARQCIEVGRAVPWA